MNTHTNQSFTETNTQSNNASPGFHGRFHHIRFFRLNIGTKLGLGFSFLLILTIILGIMSLVIFSKLPLNIYKQLISFVSISLKFQEARSLEKDFRSYYKTGGFETAREKYDKWLKCVEEIEKQVKKVKLENNASGTSIEIQIMVIEDAIENYKNSVNNLISDNIIKNETDEFQKAARIFDDSRNSLIGIAIMIIKNSFQDLNKKTVPIYIALLMVIISAGITMAYIFTKDITRPIVQLTTAAERISGGDLTVQTQVESDDEIGKLAATFNNMAVKLAESYHSLEESKETAETYLAKLRQELDTGRRIQKDFLPEEVPQPDGWEFATCFNPARAVAGDFYDIFPLPGNCVGLVIGDVCDKGVGSALFMAIFRSLLRVYSEQASLLGLTRVKIDDPNFDEQMENLACASPLKAAALTNNYIVHNHSKANMFATLFFGVLHPAKGLLTYVNGGHDAPAIFSQIGVKTRLTPTGPAVGLMPNINFDIRQVQLDPGDILIAYTDGVTDAKDPYGNRFTEDKLLSLLEQPFPSAADLLEHIENSVLAHIADATQFDDITMLAVRWVPEPVQTGG